MARVLFRNKFYQIENKYDNVKVNAYGDLIVQNNLSAQTVAANADQFVEFIAGANSKLFRNKEFASGLDKAIEKCAGLKENEKDAEQIVDVVRKIFTAKQNDKTASVLANSAVNAKSVERIKTDIEKNF